MKKIIIAAIALTTLAITASSSKAGNSDDVTIGILGGVVGGLILGDVLDRPRHHHRHVEYYEYEEPVVVRECYTKYRRYYDEYRGRYVKRPVTKCYWVER